MQEILMTTKTLYPRMPIEDIFIKFRVFESQQGCVEAGGKLYE